MSTNRGDAPASSSTPGGGALNPRAALLARLAERQASTLEIAQQRRKKNQQRLPSGDLVTDFLPTFMRSKCEICANMNEKMSTVMHTDRSPPKMHEITEFLDEISLRIEGLEAFLNDSAPYLTHFDTEQARIELKSLNSEFQAKREQLHPTKKFTFCRTPKTSIPLKVVSPACEPNAQPKNVSTSNSCPVNHEKSSAYQPSFDDRFSLIGIHGPCRLQVPKVASLDSSDCAGDFNQMLANQSIFLADLDNCVVHILGVSGNLIARCLRNCRVYSHPVAGSVWLEDCINCDLVFACRQLRIHSTRQCRLGLHTASRPIIETSSELLVGPYMLKYPNLSEVDLPLAGLQEHVNLWQEVEDFSHPNKRLTTGSPNWSLLPQSDWQSLIPVGDEEK